MKLAMRGVITVLLSIVVATLTLAVVPAAQAVSGGSISGVVTVPNGYDVRAVRVVVTTAGQPVAAWNPVASTMVGADGTYTLIGLPAGSYNVGFATYWSDLNPCSFGRDRWWSSPGQAAGTCLNDTLSGAGEISVTDGAETNLGSIPLLSNFPEYHYSGKVVAPAGHTTGGMQVELWSEEEGAWYLPGGWYRLTSVPTQTLTDSGEFDFGLIDPPWPHRYAIRFVDHAAQGYAFSFANGGLTSASTGVGGTSFGQGSVGLLSIPQYKSSDADLGSRPLKFELGYTSGGVTVTGSPEWGRTLTAQSNIVWADPSVGTVYQWYRNGGAIDGATGDSYALDTLEDGFEATISVRALPSGAWAYNGAPVESAGFVIENTTPNNSVKPSVSGTTQVGRVLTASPGSWRPTLPDYTYTYQWFRGSSSIAGATSSTYTVTSSDLGSRLSVEVTAMKPPTCPACGEWFTGPAAARSEPGATVTVGTILSSWISKWPTVSGTARVGHHATLHSLKLTTAGSSQHLKASYRWYVGGKRIRGATSSKLKIVRAYRHHTVVAKVTISKSGCTSRTKSVSFGKVR